MRTLNSYHTPRMKIRSVLLDSITFHQNALSRVRTADRERATHLVAQSLEWEAHFEHRAHDGWPEDLGPLAEEATYLASRFRSEIDRRHPGIGTGCRRGTRVWFDQRPCA